MSLGNGDDHKVRATVMHIDWERHFAKAVDAHGHDFFLYYSAFEMMGKWQFEDLRTGSLVALTPIAHPRGLRGVDVRILEL